MYLTTTARKDLILICIILTGAFLLFCYFDLLEAIVAFSNNYETFEIDEIISTLIVFAFCMAFYAWRRLLETNRAREELKGQKDALQRALNEVKTLKEIIPICSYCHKIRTEEGAWDALYSYINKQLNPGFSHGICPDCLSTQIREIEELKKNRQLLP